MVETITYSKVFAQDLALGTGTQSVTLADGSTETLDEINIATFGGGFTEASIPFANASGVLTEDNTNLNFDDTNNRLRVPTIVGSTLASGTLTLRGTTNATVGNILLAQEDGSYVGIGGVPSSNLHVRAAGISSVWIENDSAIVGNPEIQFKKQGTTAYTLGVHDLDSDKFKIQSGATLGSNPSLAIDGTSVYINTTANVFMTAGLTVDMQTNTNEAFALQSSGSVSHGMTTETEDDTFFTTQKISGAAGADLLGWGQSTRALKLTGSSTTETTVKSNASVAPVLVDSRVKSGTTIASLATANANVFAVANNTSTLMILDIDGDLFLDGSATITTYDDHDDIKLLQAFRTISAPDLRQTLGDWVDDHLDILEQHRVISREPNSHPFISVKGLFGLMIDTMRQMHTKIEKLEQSLLPPPNAPLPLSD